MKFSIRVPLDHIFIVLKSGPESHEARKSVWSRGLPSLFLFPPQNQTKNNWDLKFGTKALLWHIKKPFFYLFSRKNYFINHYFWLSVIFGDDETWYYSHTTESNDVKYFQIILKFDSITPQKMSSNSGVISQKTFFLKSVYWLN